MAEEIIYSQSLLGVKVTPEGKKIGTLRDAALVPLIDPSVWIVIVGAGPGWLSIRYDQVQSIGAGWIHSKTSV